MVQQCWMVPPVALVAFSDHLPPSQPLLRAKTPLTISSHGCADTICLLPPQVVVQLTDDLLSQAVMMVEDSRPTLAINLAGARQHWLEGMLRHEIGQRGGVAVGDGHSWGGGAGRCEHPLSVGIMAWGLWGPRGKVIPAGSCKEASWRGAPGWVLEGAEANWAPLCVWGWGCWAPTHVLAPHPGQRSKHMSHGSISSQGWSWHPWVLGLSSKPSDSGAGRGGAGGQDFWRLRLTGLAPIPPRQAPTTSGG